MSGPTELDPRDIQATQRQCHGADEWLAVGTVGSACRGWDPLSLVAPRAAAVTSRAPPGSVRPAHHRRRLAARTKAAPLGRWLDLEAVELDRVLAPQFLLVGCGAQGDDLPQGVNPFAELGSEQTHGPIAAKDHAVRPERVETVVHARCQILDGPAFRRPSDNAEILQITLESWPNLRCRGATDRHRATEQLRHRAACRTLWDRRCRNDRPRIASRGKARQLATVAQFGGSHAEIKVHPQRAELPDAAYEIVTETRAGGDPVVVHDLPHSLGVARGMMPLDVRPEVGRCRPTTNRRADRLLATALGQAQHIVRFGIEFARIDVHFHVHGLDVEPARRGSVFDRSEAVLEHLGSTAEPRQLLRLQVPQMLMGVDDERRVGRSGHEVLGKRGDSSQTGDRFGEKVRRERCMADVPKQADAVSDRNEHSVRDQNRRCQQGLGVRAVKSLDKVCHVHVCVDMRFHRETCPRELCRVRLLFDRRGLRAEYRLRREQKCASRPARKFERS